MFFLSMGNQSSLYIEYQVENNNISIIIPALNEESNIKACIESAQRFNPLEIIVVDGGSTDRTKEIVINSGATVIQSQKGRGIQMNRGASLAKGDTLLFLHADSRLPLINDEDISKKVMHDYVGGFFRLRFDDSSFATRLVELFANIRARLFSLPYGDQAIFIRKDIFEKIGGFREYPFLEDIDMSIRLKRLGKLIYLPYSVKASSRSIQKGFLFSPIFVSLRNVLIALLFVLGVKPFQLIKLYK